MEDILNNIFTFSFLFKVGAIVFSLVSIIFTIQLYANIKQATQTILTKRNIGIRFITACMIAVSIFLCVGAFLML